MDSTRCLRYLKRIFFTLRLNSDRQFFKNFRQHNDTVDMPLCFVPVVFYGPEIEWIGVSQYIAANHILQHRDSKFMNVVHWTANHMFSGWMWCTEQLTTCFVHNLMLCLFIPAVCVATCFVLYSQSEEEKKEQNKQVEKHNGCRCFHTGHGGLLNGLMSMKTLCYGLHQSLDWMTNTQMNTHALNRHLTSPSSKHQMRDIFWRTMFKVLWSWKLAHAHPTPY